MYVARIKTPVVVEDQLLENPTEEDIKAAAMQNFKELIERVEEGKPGYEIEIEIERLPE